MNYLNSSHIHLRRTSRRLALATLCAAALLLAAPSCEKTPAPSPEPASAIGFTSAAPSTKAIIDGETPDKNTIAKDAFNNDSGFGVIGYRYKSGWDMTFTNQKVTPVAESGALVIPYKWTYDPLQFWEAADYRFFAYYPYDDKHIISPTSKYTIDVSKCLESTESNIAFGVTYTVPNSWSTSYQANQVDFMLAAPALETGIIARTAPVDLNFKHALCQVGFRICTSADVGDNIKVVDLQLTNLNSKSTATIKNDGSISWGSKSAPLNYSYTKSVKNAAIPYCPPSPADPVYLVAPNMLLLPQGFNDTNKVTITVKDTSQGDKTWTLTSKISQPTLDKWEPGKIYIYTIKINTDPLLMDMSLEITDWTDVNINVTI